MRGARRHWLAVGIPIAALLLVVYTIAFLIDEPLRRYTEANVNRALKGYTAHIGRLDFHPFGFSLDLKEVVIRQDAHPDPPVLRLEHLSASVHWRALLSGRVEGDRRPHTGEGPRLAGRAAGDLSAQDRPFRNSGR
jgi:hypothetical protein